MLYGSNLKEFQRAAGRLDASQTFNEMSLRHFECDPQFVEDGGKFIAKRSVQLGLKVDNAAVHKAREVNSQLWILALFSLFEEFLFTLDEEVRRASSEALFPPSSKVQQAIESLPFVHQGGETKKRVLHYYRLVRNVSAHPFARRQTMGEIASHAARLNSFEDQVIVSLLVCENYTFPESDAVSYQDSIMCSRLLKAIAEEIVALTILRSESTLLKIRATLIQDFSRFTAGTDAFKKRVVARLRTEFCLGESLALALYSELFRGV